MTLGDRDSDFTTRFMEAAAICKTIGQQPQLGGTKKAFGLENYVGLDHIGLYIPAGISGRCVMEKLT
ncbi:MAG: hypothetical protein P8130_04340 [Deltaproteobacteria bacterium]